MWVGMRCVRGLGCVHGVRLHVVCLFWGWRGVDGSCAWRVPVVLRGMAGGFEHEKGIWWMPWRQEAMKDVARCENPGGAASRL